MITRTLRPCLFALSLGLLALSIAPAAETLAPLELRTAFPAPGATGVCPDTPLRLTFAVAPALGTAGKIEVRDAADGSLVDSIDVAAPIDTQSIGGLPNYRYHRALLTERSATLVLRNGALAYGRTYYVTIAPGAFARTAGLDQSTAWRFSTKGSAPPAGTTRLTVAADGTGDFCTVQGALDFVPAGNTTPTTIFIRKGTYTGIVFVTEKHALTLLGEDRQQTVIAYPNNDRFNNASGGNPFGGPSPDPAASTVAKGPIYRRGLFMGHRVSDLTLANLTLRNTTPIGGSQAEAIILNGTTTARAVIRDVDLFSFQDTLQINGQAYLTNCRIEGDVDFMWGTGPCFFENCTFRTLRSGAYFTQVRNPPTNHGFVYLRCTFAGGPGVTGNFLTRVEPNRFPASEVVLLDCTLTDAVSPVAWQLQRNAAAPNPDLSRLHFWEFNSHDSAGKPVDTTQRLAVSRQLKHPDDDALIAGYSNPAFVLGGWDPKAASK